MIEQLQTNSDNIIAFKLSGKLHDEDYKVFVPAVEAAVSVHGKVRLLAQFEDFQGWDAHAAWDDFKFGVKHYADFERLAFIGDNKWEEWMARLCKPFTQASVKYFDTDQAEAAWAWVRAN